MTDLEDILPSLSLLKCKIKTLEIGFKKGLKIYSDGFKV